MGIYFCDYFSHSNVLYNIKFLTGGLGGGFGGGG